LQILLKPVRVVGAGFLGAAMIEQNPSGLG
jgi:hypothetical protein